MVGGDAARHCKALALIRTGQVEINGGVFFSNRKIATTSPGIMDLAPTILKLLEVPLPADLDGKPLL